jgi:hypothetical protein
MGNAKARNVAMIPLDNVTDLTETGSFYLNDEENKKGILIAEDC